MSASNLNNENSHLDVILNELGSFGKYQIKNYIIFTLPIIFNAIFSLSYVFEAGDLNYRCQVPECENVSDTTYEPLWLLDAVPFNEGSPAKCQRFSRAMDESSANGTCYFNRTTAVRCHEFIFEDDRTTILKDFNLTCDENEWKLTFVGTINNIGQFICFALTGYLSDRYGRRVTIIWGLLGSATAAVIRSFSTNYIFYLLMEIIDPALGSGIYSSAFILAVELVASDQRLLGSTIISTYFPIGSVLLGLAAMYLKNWRHLIRITNIPALLIISYYWVAPESVRWLLSKGRYAEATAIIKKAAKVNKVHLSDTALSNLYDITKIPSDLTELSSKAYFDPEKSHPVVVPKKEEYPMMEVFQSPIIMLRLLNCSFCWLINTFVFYGLSLNSVSLSGNKYLNFIYASLIEIPGYFVSYFTMNYLGRKISLSASLILSGLACFASEFLPEDQKWLKISMYLIGKFAITVSFTVIFLYTTEFFPTNIRHRLLGICSMFGRFGSMIAPQTPLLERIWHPLPLVLFGGTAIISGILSLHFPETLNTVLPDTISEAENIGRPKRKKFIKVIQVDS